MAVKSYSAVIGASPPALAGALSPPAPAPAELSSLELDFEETGGGGGGAKKDTSKILP
jgi:hypothetical protein